MNWAWYYVFAAPDDVPRLRASLPPSPGSDPPHTCAANSAAVSSSAGQASEPRACNFAIAGEGLRLTTRR